MTSVAIKELTTDSHGCRSRRELHSKLKAGRTQLFRHLLTRSYNGASRCSGLYQYHCYSLVLRQYSLAAINVQVHQSCCLGCSESLHLFDE